jgi:lysophospholipase L1-like esterase
MSAQRSVLSPRSRRVIRGCAALLFALVLALMLAELGLRLFWPIDHRAPLNAKDAAITGALVHRRSDVPGLVYELAPGARGSYAGMPIEINALGMRGPETTREKPRETFRIAALGDSLTFGYGVRAEESWPAALERALAEDPALLDGRRPEVLNMGVSGYGTRDEALVLEHKALALDPDLVIVGYFLNDPQTEPLQNLVRWFREPDWWERLQLWRLYDWKRFVHDKEKYGHGDGYRYLHAVDGPCWSSVPEAFDDMRRAASAHGVPILVVTLPAFAPFPDWPHYRWSDLHAQVLAAAAERGFATLDPVPAFVADGRAPRDLGVDSEHPNAAGHEILARAIVTEIRRERARLVRHAVGR